MKLTQLLLLAVACSTASALWAQDKPQPVVESEDLGDGFRAVSVNGGPPAIVDDKTGLILKLVKGRPAVVDQENGVLLFEGDDGEPIVKVYGGKKGGDQKPLDKKSVARMKAYMRRVQEHGKSMDRIRADRERAADARAEKKKTHVKSLEALCLEQLGDLDDESKLVIVPLLRSILEKLDQIRRSTVDLTRPRRTSDLPAAIQAFLKSFKALRDGAPIDPPALQAGLKAFRAARTQQDAELASLRGRLREVLTLIQEAKLTALGVLE